MPARSVGLINLEDMPSARLPETGTNESRSVDVLGDDESSCISDGSSMR